MIQKFNVEFDILPTNSKILAVNKNIVCKIIATPGQLKFGGYSTDVIHKAIPIETMATVNQINNQNFTAPFDSI